MTLLRKYVDECDIPRFNLPTVTRDSLERVVRGMLRASKSLDIYSYDISIDILISVWPVIRDMLVIIINQMFSKGICR